ncbi:unnamed protein product [Paramecium pentaurelia]|uniref:VLIG-type G domain-containing protein n=1 Tax=Paramecium pentaurelia TaxID=43138 RepID=A0A8S1W1Y2_9CILI|nr:unnamed protein product [Paramecium pentaurelia]
MNQSNSIAQIALLYSIKTDDAQDFQLEKIDFMNNITKQFYSTIQNEILQVKGLFGTYQEVQREIQLQINEIVNLQSYLSHSEKGSLIAIKYENVMIFCLILSETFFVTKPINEKAIEIVLFRVLQDLTDNIQLCFNDAKLKKNWYQGDIIPFNQIQQRTEYYFAESENNQMQEYDCKWILSSKNITNYKIINSQTLSPQLTRVRKLQFSQQELEIFVENFNNFILSLLLQILNTNQKQINQLIKIFKIEHQSKNLKNLLDKLSDDLEKEANIYKSKLIEKLIKVLKSQYKSNTNEDKKRKIEQLVNNVLQTVELTDKRVLIYNYGLIDKNAQETFAKEMDYFLNKIVEKISGIKSKYSNEKNEIINELQKQTSYEVERISLKLSRVNENESGKVLNISQIDNQQYTILNGNFLQLQSSTFKIEDIFETKEKAHIYIITSVENINKGCKTHIYFHIYKTTQIQPIKQLDFKDTQQAVYFHDYSRGYLYIFNFKKHQVLQMIITPRGSIQNESQVYYQHELSSYFNVSHAAYLKIVNKFIVLSTDSFIYKQQDQGQDFEKVKCKIQNKNDIKQEDFKATFYPDYKYNQLIACPSGKYFYLANFYCCDRYDLNCLKIDYIKIDGPIKIFANFSDVIILGQLDWSDQKAKTAKIISNLVSQKKFNKQENQEKKAIGNPALDIAKGSFIKFGPNSQFLLKEKKRNINIYANKEYYDIMESYLNIMKVNEIILSSSMLQFAEFKSEQIKDIIFSRVPLQLCTIENSNLIPLNDGFRQQSQTQTIISVDQKVKQLHLGFLEDHLSNYNNKIFVVGIIGKQSSGKSYLLNRVFGTRFSVSSARCTDGVWGSIAYIEDQTFLVLDCEGLFNGARTDKEEIKMLAFLTALCDITILNSDLTFNRHFNDLFNHLVEASKQLNDEKLFKGILYFVLRDVSSNDNSGAEKELLTNLERLKEGGTEEIVFLKRLFNNKIAVEPLVNYELKLFDEQISSVRNYILQKSAQSNHWNCGRELIQIMKILLCQLELSDNTNVSLIDLQILIEKIFEDSKELWYNFSSNDLQDSNLKLVQSQYKFIKFEEYQHILFNQDLLKQLYENLITEDTISTHNKNLLQIRTQFNLMMEQRKDYILQRALAETKSINNEEVKVIIEKNMSMLKIFLTDQIKQYQFCEDKCNDCHLQCKSFKNHIEISQTLMQKLDEAINSLEDKQKKSKIKNKTQEQEKRERIDQIKEEIKEAEYTLEGLIIQKKIIDIKEKLLKEKDALKNYDFYDSNGEYINTSVFQMTQFQNESLQTATLEYMESIQNLFFNEIPLLLNTKEQNNQRIQQQKAQLEQLNKDLIIEKDNVREIETNQDKIQSTMKKISEQKLKKVQDLQRVQNEISTIQIVGQDINIPNLQSKVQEENSKLIEIEYELEDQELIFKKNSEELERLLKMQEEEQIQYLDQLEQDINEYLEKQNQLDEEIETLKKKKRDIEEIRSKLEKEKSKKMGRNEKKIMELNQELKGLDEKLINDQLQQCELKQKEIEQNFKNFENSELYNQCIEEIQQEQEQDQMDNKCIEQIQKEQEQDQIDNKCIEQIQKEQEQDQIDNKCIEQIQKEQEQDQIDNKCIEQIQKEQEQDQIDNKCIEQIQKEQEQDQIDNKCIEQIQKEQEQDQIDNKCIEQIQKEQEQDQIDNKCIEQIQKEQEQDQIDNKCIEQIQKEQEQDQIDNKCIEQIQKEQEQDQIDNKCIEQIQKEQEQDQIDNKCIEQIQKEQEQDQIDNKCIEQIQKEQEQDQIDNKCIEQIQKEQEQDQIDNKCIEQIQKEQEQDQIDNKCIEQIQKEQEQDQIDNKCIEQIQKEQEQDQIDNKCIEKYDIEIQTSQLEMVLQNQENQCLQNEYFETNNQNQEKILNVTKLQIIKLLLKKKEEKVLQCKVQIYDLKEQIEQMKNKIDNINQKIQEKLKMNKLLSTLESQKSDISQIDERLESLDQKLLLEAEKLCKIKQNQETIKNKIDKFLQNNMELENKNALIDEQINKLNLRLDQIKIFSENLSEYIILKNTLQEEEIQLQKFNEFQPVKNLPQSDVYSKIQQFENKIQILKGEKDSLSNQLSTFNQFVLLEQDLRNLQDFKKKLVELQFEVHSCQRESHKCDQNCKICPNQICDHKAGHDEKEEHLCIKQDHRCQEVCQVINCERKCMKSFKHDLQHKCENDHPCMEKCQYCDKKCKKDRSDPHYQNHDCQDNSCTHNCKLCPRRCCQSHQHSKQKDNHFCENVHYCQEQCQEDGICKLEYEVIQATWKTQLSEFQYTKYIPKDIGKQICQKQIPAKIHQHDGKHLCKEKTEKQFHLCNQQCPECNTYCDQKYGHQGPHSSDRHRNKENQIFTIQEGNKGNIEIQDQKQIRKYQIGESSAPESCDQSCKRRGRSHFHLVKCLGGYNCLEKKNQYKARHSKEKYVQFEHLNFDEVLCIDFWKLNNWVHPILNELDIITKCNYFCPLCIQQTINYQFCDCSAWHTNDDKISAHSFSCIENHLQNQIQGINVTFVIDSTLSMGKYIDMCKLTIKDIMQKSIAQKNVHGKQLEVNFAAVSYKDHKTPYDGSQNIIDIQDFTTDNVIISFLDKIVLENGIDYPEAVLDGLDASLKLKWNPNYEKLLYLIADAPPHGTQYSNYWDNFPEGCPCGLKQESIFRTLQNIKVKFKILKLNQYIDMMIAEFKKDFKDLQILSSDKQDEVTFSNLIVNDVCKFLAHNEITYQMKK